jgi:hypothetical protein
MVALEREHAIAGDQVEITSTGGVDQVTAIAADPRAVESERSQDPTHLRVDITVIESHFLAGAGADKLCNPRNLVLGHGQA